MLLAHDALGDGPPLLLIHGFPLSRRIWRAQQPLAASGYRVIIPDLPGFGATPADPDLATMSGYADALVALLDHYAIARCVIGGMSMGGYVLFNLLDRYPDRLAGAVFAVTRAGGDDEAGKAKRSAMAQSALDNGSATIAASFAAILFAEQTARQQPQLVIEVTRWMEASSPCGMAAALHAMRDRPDYTPRLKDISTPTLVIGARDDRTIPVEQSRLIAAGIPGARYEEIPDAGHLAMLEQPEPFNRALLGFLDQLPPW